MITITVGNSYSKIEGLSTSQMMGLKKVLSYNTDPKARFYAGGTFPTRRYLIDARGAFPTGLLHRVKGFLGKVSYSVKDTRARAPIQPVDHGGDFSTIQPYKAQMKAVEIAAVLGRGIIAMPTGTGKSLVMALITHIFNVRTLIVVPNLEIKKQLTEGFSERFKDMSNITIENIDSKALKKATDYELLIIDEAHHSAAKTYRDLNKKAWNNIRYRLFMTATPFRNDPEEALLFESIAGEIIYQLPYKEAISEGYIVPVEAYYIEIPKQKTEAYTYREVYDQLVVGNTKRNDLIAMLLSTLLMSGNKTLCLVKEIEHGNILSELTGAPFANGQDEDSREFIEKFNKGELITLIGTTGIIGEGVDTKPCEYVIIAGLGKAKSAFMQQVGRAVRKYPGKESAKVILIFDKSHKFLSRHFREQCDILKTEYGVTPTKLEI